LRHHRERRQFGESNWLASPKRLLKERIGLFTSTHNEDPPGGDCL